MIEWDKLTQEQFELVCKEAMTKLAFDSQADLIRYAVCHVVDSLREEEKMNKEQIAPGCSLSYDEVESKFPEAFKAVPECYIVDCEVEFYLDYVGQLCAETPFGASRWDDNVCQWFDGEN